MRLTSSKPELAKFVGNIFLLLSSAEQLLAILPALGHNAEKQQWKPNASVESAIQI